MPRTKVIRTVVYFDILAVGGAKDPISSMVPPPPLRLVLVGDVEEDEEEEEEEKELLEDVVVDCGATIADDVVEVAAAVVGVVELAEIV